MFLAGIVFPATVLNLANIKAREGMLSDQQ